MFDWVLTTTLSSLLELWYDTNFLQLKTGSEFLMKFSYRTALWRDGILKVHLTSSFSWKMDFSHNLCNSWKVRDPILHNKHIFFSWTIDIHFQGLRLFISIIVSTTTLTCPITLFSCYPVICFRYYIIYTYGSSKSRPQ